MSLTVACGEGALVQEVQRWLQQDRCEKTRLEIQECQKNEQWDKLESVLLRGRLEFGTAGLRGPMKAGYVCMNELVILQTAQGLCEYVKTACTPEQLKIGIVVGYDGRYNSKRFAELTTRVFTKSSINVCLFGDTCPTPWVSFAVKYYKAAAGVMVTASHNPKEDNGYKVYWSNGAQIIGPHDKNIEAAILNNLSVDEDMWDTDGIRSHELVSDHLDEVSSEYLAGLHKSINPDVFMYILKAQFPFVYSAMHGVGYPYIEKAFNRMGLQPVIPVEEQVYPDPDFSTVEFPNPEEPASLTLSLRLAEQKNCTVVLANDPDADRLAVAEYQQDTNTWHILTGNEAGALLGWWILHNFLKQRPEVDPSSATLLASAVSSKMLRAIAAKHGATFIETLTGFKWMGGKSVQLANSDKFPIFAFEEAIGFMCGVEVPDKDGISAAVHFASLCSYLKTQGKTLLDQLDWLYTEYGYHITDNSYYICHDKEVFTKIFTNLRNYAGTSDYPKSLRDWDICNVRDLDVKGDPDAQSGTGLDKLLSSGQMLTLTFTNGLVATIRTSGTEPKIKYYTELCAKPGQGDREELKVLLKDMVAALIEDFLQPAVNGLIERK